MLISNQDRIRQWKGITEFKNAFENAGGDASKVSLDDIKKQMDNKYDLIVIDSETTIIKSTEYLEEELKRLDTANNLPLTLIMLDVNGLKLINDAFGHSVGDKVLQSAARIMQSECGIEDVIARFGGDEFVIILPGTSTNGVEQMLKRIENRLANESF